MRRILIAFACLGVAAAAVTGCGGSSSGSASRRSTRSPTPSSTPTLALDRGAVGFSKSDVRRLRHVFLAERAFLVRKGMTGASRIKLQLLSGSHTFYCSPVQTTYTSGGPGPDYCQPTPGAPVGTVVLNARFLSNDVPQLVAGDSGSVTGTRLHSTELGAAATVLAHELGHAEEALLHGHSALLEGTGVELEADCYAGQMVARAEPRLLAPAMQFMRHVPGDSQHGSARERLGAFERGARGGSCTAHSLG